VQAAAAGAGGAAILPYQQRIQQEALILPTAKALHSLQKLRL
jgi:hypothetical protein